MHLEFLFLPVALKQFMNANDGVMQEIEDVGPFNHDWLRAMRMASYGFLIYGPFSQVWYEVLDHLLPAKNLTNLSLKVGGYYPFF